MRRGLSVWALGSWLLALLAFWAPGAAAAPASGPREDVDYSFTTTQPGAPTGLDFSGSYHAAGDPSGSPPFMKRMVFYLPAGMRVNTSVPARCTASDVELSIEGPDACPAGSLLGTGTTSGVFMAPGAHSVVLDHYTHTLYVMNAADEQIVLVKSEGYTVVRAHVSPDGSQIEYTSPTCFPSPPTGQCADDYVLQTSTTSSVPVYTRSSGGSVRSYATTPPTCPASGHWTSTIVYSWKDGSVDRVRTAQPCG
jgi:hypothetical protein